MNSARGLLNKMGASNSSNQKPILTLINKTVSSKNLKKIEILDLGCGYGNFGKLIKKNIKIPVKITGVDIWEKYRNRRWSYYNKIVIKDIKDFLRKNKKKFDIVLLIDVLEHLDKKDGERVLKKIIKISRKAAIISTPVAKYPQKKVFGNPYEKHRYIWKESEILKKGFKRIMNKRILMVYWPFTSKLGVYCIEK